MSFIKYTQSENQCGKLNFWSTRPKTDVPCMFYTKFHSPRPFLYSPSSKCIRIAGWETKIIWYSPELGSPLYSLYKIPLAQACFPLARPNFHSHWRALVSQPELASGRALVSLTENYNKHRYSWPTLSAMLVETLFVKNYSAREEF